MINKINMINCATYDENGASIEECKKINYIYGSNGSGKSTISNYLKNQRDPKYKDCSISWRNGVELPIEVYNREFREQNFQNTNIPGVFTLGSASIEEKKEIEKLKDELENLRQDIITKGKTLDTKNTQKEEEKNKIKELIWKQIYKTYGDKFPELFEGLKKKDKLCDAVLNKYNNGVSKPSENLDALTDSYVEIFANDIENWNVKECNVDELLSELDIICNDEKLSTPIVGNKSIPIANLITKLNNLDWVSSGRKYIKIGNKCPFCQQETITDGFRKELELFFDKEFEESVSHLEGLRKKYSSCIKSLMDIFSGISNDQQYLQNTGIDQNVWLQNCELIRSQVQLNEKTLDDKIESPEKKITISFPKELILSNIEMVKSANKKVEAHNQLLLNIKKSKEEILDKLWDYCISTIEMNIMSYNNSIKGITKAINSIEKLQRDLIKKEREKNEEIIEKSKNITSVQPTVNEINRLLAAYGFTNFSIVASKEDENSYQILRNDGSLANNTLSEGEETFISFLYFMQMVKGSTNKDNVGEKKIIVLDDPICSLDSTVLYIVSTMVKRLANDIRNNSSDVAQLFVLTHNVFFHKEASFIDGRTKELKDVNYWIIKKDSNISQIFSYGMNNPISTSYELLWKELKIQENGSLISLQNTMRRIIENYFGMLGGKKDDYIKDKFESIEDQTICESLFYWINDGSHTIPDDLFIDSYTDSPQKYLDVFKQIFEKTNNIAHYNMMMGIEES